MRIVLDTNCLLVIVPKKSQYRILFDLIVSGKISLVVTTEILLEYEEQLSKFYSEVYANLIINVITSLPNTIYVNTIYFNWLLISQDKDDNKYIDAYVAGKSEYIISNDKHFDHINSIEFPRVRCMKLFDYFNLLKV